MRTLFLSVLGLLLLSPPALPSEKKARQAADAAIGYLLRSQNRNGSWGGPGNPGPGDGFWWNIETHRAWTQATTSLCFMALLDQKAKTRGMTNALEKALQFLVDDPPVKRPSDWDVDNTWAHLYTTQALARAHASPLFQEKEIKQRIRETCVREIETLFRYQTPSGGWAYYDFETRAQRPSWATSFMTAAVLIAFFEARGQRFHIEEKWVKRALKALERCRLPSGAYTYSVSVIPGPGGAEWIDQVKGSLGRIQIGNLALHMYDRGITPEDLSRGLDLFFLHHKFLDVARKRPIPHEAYYLNSGYFFYFGHYYASLVIERLPKEKQGEYWRQLRLILVERQEKDGSMWDYYMSSYGRPYATAYGLMALTRSLNYKP